MIALACQPESRPDRRPRWPGRRRRGRRKRIASGDTGMPMSERRVPVSETTKRSFSIQLAVHLMLWVSILAISSRVTCQPEESQGQQQIKLAPRVKPPGAECLQSNQNAIDRLVRLPEALELQASQSANNTMQVFKSNRLVEASNVAEESSEVSKEKRAANSRGAIQMFASICSGWTNSIDRSAGHQQQAYWVLDRRRQALVAKFNYFDPTSSHELAASREAKLVSPIFRPLPSYHSMRDSKYFASCKFHFRSYLTMRAHLDLYLIRVPTSGQQQQQQPMAADLLEPVILKQLIDNRRGHQLASRVGEPAAWSDHTVELPTNLGKSLYRLEFSAMNSILVSSESTGSYGFLKGIAVANFSLSPQCFGLDVERQELERVLKLTGENPLDYSAKFSSLSDSNLNNSNLTSRQQDQAIQTQSSQQVPRTEVGHFLESYKGILFGSVVLILVLLVASTQYLLCLYHQSKSNSPPGHSGQFGLSGRGGGSGSSKYLDSMFCCWCCYNYCPIKKQRSQFSSANSQLSNLVNGRQRPKRRHRVYTTNASQGSSNNKYSNEQGQKLQEELMLRNHLRPLSGAFENFELNENPNYLTNGIDLNQIANNNNTNNNKANMSALTNCAALEPYQIEREQLTFTQPSLGRGAFGEVHRGYLAGYYATDDSGDLTLLNERQLRGQSASRSGQDLELDSVKVAIKTLTDDRMSQDDFVREAINMSQVRHRNIVKFIGVCFERRPLYIVMELLEGGNLKNFLLKNRDKTSTGGGGNNLVSLSDGIYNVPDPLAHARLNMGDLLVFALDIARACDYLQQQQFIHRDLAARNVLLTRDAKREPFVVAQSPQPSVGAHSPFGLSCDTESAPATNSRRNFVGSPPSALDVDANHKVNLEQVYLNGYRESGIRAKLADFGMTRDVYTNNYYRFGGKELPVRWMPPECLDGVATTQSDVWSFGVFLWEVFSMGQLPYQHLLDNQKVIEFLRSRRCARPRDQQKQSQSQASQANDPSNNNNNNNNSKEIELLLTISNENVATSANITPLPAEDLRGQTPMSNLIADSRPASQNQSLNPNENQQTTTEQDSDLGPPLPAPHENTPHPIYSIMCKCWAINPEERPDFASVANQLYWCLQMDDVLGTSLPCFYEQQTSHRHSSTGRPSSSQNTNHQSAQADHRLGAASGPEAQRQYQNQLSANHLDLDFEHRGHQGHLNSNYLNAATDDEDDDDEGQRILSPETLESDAQSTYLAAASQGTQTTQLNWW